MSALLQAKHAGVNSKTRIARQFSQAASRYDQFAKVQLDIGFDALALLGGTYSRLLDIGCGTGRLSRYLAPKCEQLLAMDLAEGMLAFACEQEQQNPPNIQWLQGDAEQLPLSDNSLDGIFSTMVLQWCPNIQQVCREIHRVLAPGAQGVLAILVEGSMDQLQQSWLSLDSQKHVNQFYTSDNWQQAAQVAGLRVQGSEQAYTTWHQNVRELLGSIKAIGANVVTETGNHRAISRAGLRDLQHTYHQRFGRRGLLPLSYQVCFLQLTKD